MIPILYELEGMMDLAERLKRARERHPILKGLMDWALTYTDDDMPPIRVRVAWGNTTAPSCEQMMELADFLDLIAPPPDARPDVDEAADAITKIAFEQYDRGEGGGKPFRLALRAELARILAGPADANMHSGDGR